MEAIRALELHGSLLKKSRCKNKLPQLNTKHVVGNRKVSPYLRYAISGHKHGQSEKVHSYFHRLLSGEDEWLKRLSDTRRES